MGVSNLRAAQDGKPQEHPRAGEEASLASGEDSVEGSTGASSGPLLSRLSGRLHLPQLALGK